MKMYYKKILVYIFWGLLLLTFILFILSLFVVIENKEMRGNANPSFTCVNTTKHENIYEKIAVSDMVNPSQLTTIEDSCGYNSPVYNWTSDKPNEMTFNINVSDAGTYNLGIDYLSLNNTILDNSISIYINGELQSTDAENMRLATSWTDKTDTKTYDANNNQVLTPQVPVKRWNYTILKENLMLSKDGVSFNFSKGNNTIKIVKESGAFLLGNLYLVNKTSPINYNDYLTQTDSTITSGQFIGLEAENSAYKNDVSIIYENQKTPNVSPYSSHKNYINVVGQFFNKPGQKITYAFNVKQAGYYNITLKYKNDFYQNINTFRNIYVNGQIVFSGLQGYKFPYTSSWTNETLGNNQAYLFYFDKGLNTLSIEVDGSEVSHSYYQIQTMLNQINDLSLDIKKLVGGQTDSQRDWNLDKYLPQAKTDLDQWSNEISSMIQELKILKSNPNQNNEFENKLKTVKNKLDELRANYNKLPSKLSLLSEGSSSVAQSLSSLAQELIDTPISLDRIYISSPGVKLPNANASVLSNVLAAFQRVVEVAKPEKTSPKTLNIWVNRSRYYVDLMQQMADAEFTPSSGIQVKFSVMPDEQKLIMANAANTQPDVALGVSGWLPYELGIRGAAADLRQFPGFNDVASNLLPGSYLNEISDGKVYGLPETEDFYVTFYRKDIFDKLGLQVPETYDDIIKILPTLQRYGMNYYLPLSNASALKPMAATAPFIYQYGGNVYSKDALSADFDSENTIKAIKMMTDLYTLYSLPLQTASFYQDFRNGDLPIGVSTFATYNQLLFAAPELKNKWAIALAPGVKQDDGTINRTYMGTAQSVVIFQKSDKKTQGFDFIKWWLSTPTQEEFINNLQTIYGEGFLWNSANVEAFKTLPINQADINVIEQQWQSLQEVPKIPAYYQVERSLSNIWNKVVFNSESVRNAVDEAQLVTNREIKRRMIEFGYIDKNDNVLKNYVIPTKQDVINWLKKGKK